MDYPRAWESRKFAAGNRGDEELIALFYATDSVLGFPVVSVARKVFAAPTLDEVAAWGEERIIAINPDYDDQYELFPLIEEQLPTGKVLSREYTMDTETPLPMMKKDVYIARAQDGIILTFMVPLEQYEDEKEVFEHMVASFRSIDAGSIDPQVP